MEREHKEKIKEYKNRLGVDKGYVTPGDHTIPYKQYKISLGESDIAQLILMGCHPEEKYGTRAQPLRFGGDGEYSAWLCDAVTDVPEHYELIALYHTWIKVYDDTCMVAYIYAGHETPIGVYRAGEYGCLIKVFK